MIAVLKEALKWKQTVMNAKTKQFLVRDSDTLLTMIEDKLQQVQRENNELALQLKHDEEDN